MAEILMSGATGILKKLVGVVSEDIALAWDVKDDLKKLQSTSEMILAVIADAEKRQEKEQLVRLWLIRLKDIAYDADDVIDEFSYEDMRLRRNREDSSKHKKIKEINKRLDEITKDMARFRLEITTPTPDGDSTGQLDRQFTSHVNESEIVGREYDESQIIKLLTTNTTSSSSSVNPNQYPEKISVISIVGMGGLGKTTLAQLVYNDELVKKVFELRMWVHFSENFDIEIILVNIMESITETNFHKLSNFCVLVNKVQEKLSGKKYLLVLDDLWNEDSEQWGILMSVLLAGAPGSKILVTTRLSQLEDDACWSIIKQKAFAPGGALNSMKMSEIGKQIAKKCCGLPLAAKFLGSLMRLKNKENDWISIRDDDIWNTPESKRKILPVLELSYNNLPSHLKQCFSYCSIFPKNWEINKETLIQLWKAEGFIKQSYVGNRKSIEDFGNEYFESLVWRSFFQIVQKDGVGDIKWCKMHDLAEDVLGENELVALKGSEFEVVTEVRRLQLNLDEDISATFMKSLSCAKKLRTVSVLQGSNPDPSIFSKNHQLRILHVGFPGSCYLLKVRSLSFFKLRHLRYLRLTSLNLSEAVYDQSISKLYNLETLVLNSIGPYHCVKNLLTNSQSLNKLGHLEVSFTDMDELPDSVTSLCNLHTLDLNNCELKFIPESISSLKNLKSLNLSVNPIKELPASVLTLSNLQTLNVNTCKNLISLPKCVADLANLKVFSFTNCPLLEALPEDFGALIQLRSLNLLGTRIKVLPESCSKLNNLEIMSLFNCEFHIDVKYLTKLKRLLYNSEELGNLNFLTQLLINNLQNVKDPIDAERANLKRKQNLYKLLLSWNAMEEEELDMIRWDQKSCNFQVFEALQPPTGLRELGIYNFKGCDLPTWMCDPSGTLMNLGILTLHNCKEIKQLAAAIGQLPRLQTISLTQMSLKSLDIGGFRSLINLDLTDMLLLEELGCSYPSSLPDLRITGCKFLTEIPSFPLLGILVLDNIHHKLVGSVGRSQTSLKQLSLDNIEELIYFPISILENNCNLHFVRTKCCNQLEGFGVINDDEKKKNVVAPYDPNLYRVSLQNLVSIDCPVLKYLLDLRNCTSLRDLFIFNCPQVKGSLSYDLKSLQFLKSLHVDFIQRDERQGDVTDKHANWFDSLFLGWFVLLRSSTAALSLLVRSPKILNWLQEFDLIPVHSFQDSMDFPSIHFAGAWTAEKRYRPKEDDTDMICLPVIEFKSNSPFLLSLLCASIVKAGRFMEVPQLTVSNRPSASSSAGDEGGEGPAFCSFAAVP
ncbi:putative disease resistance protein RGA3 [Papaver somniferum]|uniref:putative disease resistance protein RGA3 n=1 Tax=Papaver somniferum TaxID=3469 RepID=UPI000E70553B|nr:putative disease resistance protein RGA3 [Papaver somniferum]